MIVWKIGVPSPADERYVHLNYAARRTAGFHAAPIPLVLLAIACRHAPARTSASDSAGSALPTLPEAPPSRFNVPLKYDFSTVLAVVERGVPRQLGSMDSVHQVADDPRRHYAFAATRDPFSAYAEGSLVHLRARLSYQVRGYYKPLIGPTVSAGCGGDEDRPRLVVDLATPLRLDRNWHLVSKARIIGVQPASSRDDDRCKVSVLRHDVTEQVISTARDALTSELANIDRRVADVDLTDRFTEWWGLLNHPIRITDDTWLLLGPERLRMGNISGRGSVLTVQVGLDARPRIVTGAEPPSMPVPPLPPLAHDTVSNGFHIALEGVIDYATASRAMTSALRGKVVAEGGRTVTVESVTVSPATGGKLALAVTFGGDARGTLRLLGVPRYDARTGEVTVPDLDYDLTTSNQLINTYAWLRSDALRNRLRQHAHVPETPVIDRARSLLMQGLNRRIGSVMTLTATVDSVAVMGLYVTPSALVARAEARGKAAVSVRQQE